MNQIERVEKWLRENGCMCGVLPAIDKQKATELLALIQPQEVVGWESRCPDCENRVGSLGPDRPQQRICGCAFKSPLIFRPLTYGGQDGQD